jgi:alpha-galactosidase
MTSGIVFYEETDRDTFPWAQAKQAIAELKTLRPLFQGDLYPLLDLTTSQKEWYAYQLDRPDLGEGCALFFRRPDSPDPTRNVRLYNIDADAVYDVSVRGETFGEGPWRRVQGAQLEQPEIVIGEQPGSALLQYRRAPEGAAVSR